MSRCNCRGLWIFQDSKYAMFLHTHALHKVLHIPEYGWVTLAQTVLTMVELWICLFKVLQDFYYDCESKSQDSEYGKYVNMGGLHRIFDSSKLVWVCLKITLWICLNNSAVHSIEQIAEPLSRQAYLEHRQTSRIECFAKRTMPQRRHAIRNIYG